MVQKLNGRSRDRALARKREILRSAAAAFRRRGFDGASVEDIAAGLGMTKGNLYYYFKDKREILYFCQDHSADRMIEEAERIGRLRVPADEKLRRLIGAQLRCMLDELDGAAAHLEVSALPPARLDRILAKRDRYERAMRGIVEAGVRSRVFTPCDAKLAALAILGAVNWTAKWYRPDGPLTVEQISAEFGRILVQGLLRRT